jgi:UDP-glucose 4-epimerase
MADETATRCLVTGASSPLGSAVVRLLVKRGYKVAAMVRNAGSLPRLAEVRGDIELLEGALDDPEYAAGQIRKFAAQTFFHLAWQGSGREARNHSSQIDVNVTGSLKWMSAALDGGAQTWVGLGSQAEYGSYPGLLREDLITNPDNAYGLAKRCVGDLSLARCQMAGIHGVWLRLLATFGPADASGRLIPDLICTLLDGGSPQLSAGSQRWDYLYIRDAAEAVVAAAFCGTSGVFNLASGTAWEVREIATFLRNEINPKAILRFGSNSPSGLEADISGLTRATGWFPRTSLEDGLRETIDWYRAQRREHIGAAVSAGLSSVPC